jgi:hypothetical protein
VTISHVGDIHGVIVDVIYSRPCREITHAVVAIDLGLDMPTVYQPIRLGLLRSLALSGALALVGSAEMSDEMLPGFLEYELNLTMPGAKSLLPLPRSTRTH